MSAIQTENNFKNGMSAIQTIPSVVVQVTNTIIAKISSTMSSKFNKTMCEQKIQQSGD